MSAIGAGYDAAEVLTNCEAFQLQVYYMIDLALPLTQSEAFQRTCDALGLTTTRIDSTAGTCLVQTRKLPLIGAFHLASRGPVVEDMSAIPTLVRAVREQVRGPLVMNAPAVATRVGGFKIANGADLAIMDLISPSRMRAQLHQKWRNQLNKAEASDLVVRTRPLDPARDKWFLDAEANQQRARGYKSYPTGFLLAYASVNKGQARLFTASSAGEPVAAMLVLQHGAMATYQAGVTTDIGRQKCAHNLVLWTIMNDLYDQGVWRLDLGRADLSPGLRRFKQGSGAAIESLSGSFLFHHWFTRKRSNDAARSTHPDLRPSI
ncbi:MAG: GNAT family N-acetyltransferase [Pseudomonadota bacterium]